MDETRRLRRGEGYEVCTDVVTRLVCIFASQKLMFGSVKPSPPTVHWTVGTNFRAVVTA